MLPKAIEWRHDGTRPPCEPSGTLFPGTPSPTLVTQTMTGSATSGAKPLKLESSESNPQLLGLDAPDEDRATYRLRQSKRAVQAGPSGSSTIRSFQHLLRSPISSRIKVKINICYNVPDELTETATRGNPPETAYPSLKLDVYQSRTDFHVPMTAYDRAEDGSERLMDPSDRSQSTSDIRLTRAELVSSPRGRRPHAWTSSSIARMEAWLSIPRVYGPQ